MKVFLDNTLEMMDAIIEDFKDAIMIILTIIWFGIVMLTLPIWVIPYLIWKKKGDTDEQNER